MSLKILPPISNWCQFHRGYALRADGGIPGFDDLVSCA